MKNLIRLSGPPNCGKTHILNMVKRLLCGEQSDPIEEEIFSDRKYLIRYKGNRIVITTKGDGVSEIGENMEYMDFVGYIAERRPCNIAVTATHTYGKNVTKIDKYARENNGGEDPIVVEKKVEVRGNHTTTDRQYANGIKAYIDSLVPGLSDSEEPGVLEDESRYNGESTGIEWREKIITEHFINPLRELYKGTDILLEDVFNLDNQHKGACLSLDFYKTTWEESAIYLRSEPCGERYWKNFFFGIHNRKDHEKGLDFPVQLTGPHGKDFQTPTGLFNDLKFSDKYPDWEEKAMTYIVDGSAVEYVKSLIKEIFDYLDDLESGHQFQKP